MRHLYALALLFVVTAAVYTPVSRADYVYEDAGAILNPAVRGQEPIAIDRARWVSLLSHRLSYRLFGESALASHLGNLALHLANGLLVYRLGLLVVSPWSAVFAAGAFWLHPIQSEAVAYAASRSELLSTCFALLAMLVAADARRWWAHVAAWSLLALAIAAKESTVVAVPLLLWLSFVRGQRVAPWRVVALAVPCLVMAASVLWFDFTRRSELGPLEFAATQATAVWRHLGILAVPLGQTIDHDFDFVPMALRFLALSALIGWVAVASMGAWSISSDFETGRVWDEVPYLRTITFGTIWAALAIAPRFVMRAPEILNEHQWYFPFVGLSLALGAWMSGERFERDRCTSHD